MSREAEIEALATQARTVSEQLGAIHERIRQLEHQPQQAAAVAIVDPELCVACGACQKVCPAGAISVGQVARVDGTRCTGCGKCVAECPRGALALHQV